MQNRFTFPIGVALVALVFYTVTLSHGVTMASLPFTMKVAGWDWQPMNVRPLAWLLTLPVRLLPAGWIPVALNFISALCAAATLGVLARSVQRLDWDCQPDPQKPWALRLPVLLACALCGLGFNFWQDATALTGDTVDVLLLAVGILCVLEFRAGKNPRWLDAGAVVWGAGMIANWAMLLLVPFFVIAAAWLPGLRKIGKRFVLRMVLMVVAALIMFSLQPLVNSLVPHSPLRGSEAWLSEWQVFKYTLRSLYVGFWSIHRMQTFIVLLLFLLPVLACLVRIKNEAAPNVYGVERAQVWIFRLLRLGLLFASLWLAFEPGASPRRILRDQVGVSFTLLTFDYLLALGAAFLLGSLLYAAQIPPRGRLKSPLKKAAEIFRQRAFLLLALLSVGVVSALAWRSGAGMWYSASGSLARSGDFISRALPAGGGLLMANDTALLFAVQASLAQRADGPQWQPVDLQQLPLAKYRTVLSRRATAAWPTNNTQDLSPAGTGELLKQLAANHRLFYLLPQTGHFLFEQFYPSPADAVHELKLFVGPEFTGPPLTARQIEDNEQFWNVAWAEKLETWSRLPTAAEKSFPRHLGLGPVKPEPVRQTTRWFSIMLNNWGVELQRAGKLSEAKKRFEQALQLNPDNPAPPLNLLCNTNLVAQQSTITLTSENFARGFAGIQQLARLAERSGQFDDPIICVLFGDACDSANWPRQALAQFDRARQLAPDSVSPELMIAKIYARSRMPDKVFEITRHLRGYVTNTPAGQALDINLALLEAKSWLDRTNAAEADRTLQGILERNPEDISVWETVFRAYVAFDSSTNALALLDRMITKAPDNVPALNNKAALLVQLERPAEALPILDHVLTITNLPSVRLNRAIALVQAKDYAGAEKTYNELRDVSGYAFNIEYGLARIAEAKLDTNAAIAHYTLCLSNTVPESLNWKDVKAKLDTLQKK